MADKITIKLDKAWRMHPAGAQFTVDKSVGELLIQSGRGHEVIKPEEKPARTPKIQVQKKTDLNTNV